MSPIVRRGAGTPRRRSRFSKAWSRLMLRRPDAGHRAASGEGQGAFAGSGPPRPAGRFVAAPALALDHGGAGSGALLREEQDGRRERAGEHDVTGLHRAGQAVQRDHPDADREGEIGGVGQE